MTQVVLKTCTAQVRRAAAIEICSTELRFVKDRGQVCNNREQHVNPLLTGFCNSGWHEGNKIDKPTCRFWITCPCDCHTKLSRIAWLTNTERTLVDNSTWVSDRTAFVQVSLTESMQAAALAKPTATLVASELPGLAPDMIVREFAPTASGRTQRGQLEVWVMAATQSWLAQRMRGEEMPMCTPQWVSDNILKGGHVSKAPSTGAIDAVFKRWIEIGYANIGLRPTRFISFTPDGVRLGLDVLKARAKR
jgi:hypothetical protein